MKKVFLVFILIFSFLDAKFIKDFDGNLVEIPDNIEYVTPTIGAFTQMCAMLGKSDKTLSAAERLPKMMFKVFPDIKQISNISGTATSSVESIIASKTDVVFGPIKLKFDKSQIEQLNKAGIATINLDAFNTTDEIKATILKIAEILGEDALKKADEFNEYFDKNINLVSSKVANIKDKKRVLLLNDNSGNLSTIGKVDILNEYIKIAGGINLSGDDSLSQFQRVRNINAETVIAYNPDIIITNSPKSRENIAKNPAFSMLDAVKNSQIYTIPQGVYLWSVRSSEGALMPLWLAKVLYPDIFKDLNLADEVRHFYSKFYSYDLSDKEVSEILRIN